MVYIKQSPARAERIDVIVGGVCKKNHKLQVNVREVYAFFALKNSVIQAGCSGMHL